MVPEIKGTVRFDSGNIQSAQNQTSHLVPYLNGCICYEDELSLVLNVRAILKYSFVREK